MFRGEMMVKKIYELFGWMNSGISQRNYFWKSYSSQLNESAMNLMILQCARKRRINQLTFAEMQWKEIPSLFSLNLFYTIQQSTFYIQSNRALGWSKAQNLFIFKQISVLLWLSRIAISWWVRTFFINI